MNLDKGKWKFDKEVVLEFDNHVRQSVPMYDEIQNMIAELSVWFLQNDTSYYDIGSSTGHTAQLIMNVNEEKKVLYHLMDNSSAMVEYLNDKFKDKKVKSINADLANNNQYYFKNASLITSVLTLQFIPEHFRQNIINNIYDGLNKGSAFILVEKVLGSTSKIESIWHSMYHDIKLQNGLSKEHIFDKSISIRGVMNPITLEENLTMLQNAGFKEQEVFFKYGNFVGILAIK